MAFGTVLQRLRPLGRQRNVMVDCGLDVALPDLTRQLVSQFHRITIGVADVKAVGGAVLDSAVEFHPLGLQVSCRSQVSRSGKAMAMWAMAETSGASAGGVGRPGTSTKAMP
jgi:hypothetical protein